MTRQALMENVYLNYIPSEKFKTGFLSAQLVMPLERESAALNALLVNVLSRGTCLLYTSRWLLSPACTAATL